MGIRKGIALALLGVLATGCGSRQRGDVITVAGSDTMVNLAQAWAEEYSADHDVDIQVSGGGSGVGIAKLINGTVDMANASRDMKDEERAQASEAAGGAEVKEYTVALDALAVYVHKDNPMESISIQELAEIYGDNGSVTHWSQLEGWSGNSENQADEIVRVSRQNNSGTYAYFQEAVLGEDGQFKLGSIDQSGSKDVVELVSRTPNAIGYSGMGYATDEVKMLAVSTEKGTTGVPPTLASAASGSYPLARGLYIYTMGEPTGAAKAYLDWIMSPAGQNIVEKIGYCPVGAVEASETNGAESD